MTFFNNTTSIEDSPSENSDWTYIIDVTVFSLGALIVISCQVVLNTFLDKLNKIMKTILNVLCAHTATQFTILAILNSIWTEDRGISECTIMNVLVWSTGLILFAHLPLLSFLRFHLASKRARNENPNTKLIKYLTVLMYIISYTSNASLAILTTSNYLTSCVQDSSLMNKKGTAYVSIFTGIVSITSVLGIEIYYDDKLIEFLKKRNDQSRRGPRGESRLVPWTSNYQEYDFVIPIKASWACILASGLAGIGMAILNLTPSFTTKNIVVTLFPIIMLVTMLGLTFRVRKLKSRPLVLPRKLHFHGNEDEDQDQDDQDQIPQGQGLFHVNQMDLDKFRADQQSVAGDIIEQQLNRVCQELSQNQEQEEQEHHPLEEEAKAHGIKVIHVKPSKSVQDGVRVPLNLVKDRNKPKANDEPNQSLVQPYIHHYEDGSEEKPEIQRLDQERNKAGNQAQIKPVKSIQDDVEIPMDFAKDKEIEKANDEMNQTLAEAEVYQHESGLEVKTDSQIATQNIRENTIKVLEECNFDKVEEGQQRSSNDFDETLDQIGTCSNMEDLDLIGSREVILDPRILLKDQLKERRNAVSRKESLDSDLFAFFDDMEGNFGKSY